MTAKTISVCTGYGGLDDAVNYFFGSETMAWSDIDPGPISLMKYRHPHLPNLGDVKHIRWDLLPPAALFCGGYPCQPFSNAGKRLGTDDPRHIWPWIARGLGVLRPAIVVLENVAAHLKRGFDVVLSDLTALGYDVCWSIVQASDVGAPHFRKRLFILAVAQDAKRELGNQWRLAASGQAQTGRPRPDAGGRGGMAPADAEGFGLGPRGNGHERAGSQRLESLLGGPAPADADRTGLEVRNGRHGAELPPAERGDHAPADAYGNVVRLESWRRGGAHGEGAAEPGDPGALGIPDPGRWGPFALAVARWERARGIVAPNATETGQRGGQVLAPPFVEWMMGLEPGHVTGVPDLLKSRPAQLKLLGNGVVPQQALHALIGLWARMFSDGIGIAA